MFQHGGYSLHLLLLSWWIAITGLAFQLAKNLMMLFWLYCLLLCLIKVVNIIKASRGTQPRPAPKSLHVVAGLTDFPIFIRGRRVGIWLCDAIALEDKLGSISRSILKSRLVLSPLPSITLPSVPFHSVAFFSLLFLSHFSSASYLLESPCLVLLSLPLYTMQSPLLNRIKC